MRHGYAIILALCLFAFGPAASATMIVWDINNPYTFLSENGTQSATVTHDLTDDGVSEDYSVDWAVLRLGFSDGYKWYDYAYDIAHITGDGISDWIEVDGTHMWGFDIRWLGVQDAGIDSLNDNGMLEVTITAMDTPDHWGINDFWWKTSMLIAQVKSVPEPGTLGMLSLGLLGIGVMRRLRQSR